MRKASRLLLTLTVIAAIGLPAITLAAPNPSGTGQPSASCGSDNAFMMPNGFNTAGFAHAGTVYAGSDGTASLLHANSTHAVSQYDVACYQVTTNHL